MKKILIIFIFCLLSQYPNSVEACLNDYLPSENVFGDKVKGYNPTYLHFSRSHHKDLVLLRLKKLEAILAKNYSFKDHSNYAVNLSRIGKNKEALAILENLIKKYPDEYNLMANLGTVYELSSNPEKALFWIKKSVVKNPNSHKGSEWIHIKILEAKLKIKENPDWLKNNSVLGININQIKALPKNSQEYANTQKIVEDLVYQLNERVPFTPSPDEMMTNLMNDLGDLETLFDIQKSYYAYHYAMEYATKDKLIFEQKIKQIKQQLIELNLGIPEVDVYDIKGEVLKVTDYQVKDYPIIPKKEIKETELFSGNKLYFAGFGLILVLIIVFFLIRKSQKIV